MRALASLVLLLTACAPQAGVSASTAATPAVRTASPIASVDTAAYRTECARRVLSSFIEAFDRGDSAKLASFFSAIGPRSFQWFVTPETPPYGPDLSRLPDYFAAWHAAGERWRLVSVQSGEGPSWHGGVDVAVAIERTWPDRSVTSEGKGVLDCTTNTIFVFAVGDAGA